eukprot:757996-Hanusia_phi.AAC.1
MSEVDETPERVADYFVVVGLDSAIVTLQEDESHIEHKGILSPKSELCEDLNALLETRFKASIIDRFPLEDHTDTIFPPQVAMFALPEGLSVKISCPLPTFYIVVFTSNEGSRLYASVLTFHDELPKDALYRMCKNPEQIKNELWIPKEFLKQLYRVSLTASRIPVERYISNLIYEVPLPPRGRFKVQYTIADKTMELIRSPANEIPMANASLDLLFALLDRQNIVQLFAFGAEVDSVFKTPVDSYKCLGGFALLDLSVPMGALAGVCQCADSFHHGSSPCSPHEQTRGLSPVRNHPCSCHPNLPPSLLLPPPPLSPAHNPHPFCRSSCPEDVVVVNLDENSVRSVRGIPPLPAKQKKKLLEQLHQVAGDFDPKLARRWTGSIDLAFEMAPTPAESEAALK